MGKMTQDPRLLSHAAKMRREATPFEVMLWRHLSRSQLGHKFRRQHAVGRHIVDFFCPAKSLAIEVDEATHHTEEMCKRDNSLGAAGVQVLHVSNEDIATNMEGVLVRIQEMLGSLPDRWPTPHPNPSPVGEGLELSCVN